MNPIYYFYLSGLLVFILMLVMFRIYKNKNIIKSNVFNRLSENKISNSQWTINLNPTAELKKTILLKDNANENFQLTRTMHDDETVDTENLQQSKEILETNYRLKEGEVLFNKYELIKKIGQGGMGQVYTCKNIHLGNIWAIKFIDNSSTHQKLLAEEEILKKINHISLPKVIDVFYTTQGTFIVEDYIEGISLSDVLNTNREIHEEDLIKWTKELSEALSYLHKMKPNPIIYRDMKPSNIIITPDNRAVIIDFGISKFHDKYLKKDKIRAGTKKFAAPEQLIENGKTDNRSDIYSLGMTIIASIIGKTIKNETDIKLLFTKVSKEFSGILLKCIKIDPNLRYTTVENLIEDVEALSKIKLGKERAKEKLKNLKLWSAVLILVITIISSFGTIKYLQEKNAVLGVNSDTIILTEDQMAEVLITKTYKSGEVFEVDRKDIRWSVSDKKIINIDNGNIVALNSGESKVIGKHFNKSFELDVIVKEKNEDNIPINLKYNQQLVSKKLSGKKFENLESIAVDSKNQKYILESQRIHLINDFKDQEIQHNIQSPKQLFVDKNDNLYVVTDLLQTAIDSYVVQIYKYENEEFILYFEVEGFMQALVDIECNENNDIYILVRDDYNEITKIINIKENEAIEIKEFKNNFTDLAVSKDTFYLTEAYENNIFKVEKDTLVEEQLTNSGGDKGFIDGKIPLTYYPQKIEYHEGTIYILDYNIVRRLNLDDEGYIKETSTIAGYVSTDTKGLVEGSSHEILIPFSKENEVVISSDKIYFTDPINGYIRLVNYKLELTETDI